MSGAITLLAAGFPAAGPPRVTINLTISANTDKYNIVTNRGGTYVAGNTDVIITINSGVTVYSSTDNAQSALSSAMWTGTPWTTGDTITITGLGNIIGHGGTGGTGGSYNTPVAGRIGGHAIYLGYPITFSGFTGTVAGGAGGGGQGGGTYLPAFGSFYSGGKGGSGGLYTTSGTGTAGTAGSAGAGGSGGTPGVTGGVGASGTPNLMASGGGGGGYGAAGGSGGTSDQAAGAAGGVAGYAIKTNGYAVTGTPGTTYGTIG